MVFYEVVEKKDGLCVDEERIGIGGWWGGNLFI